MVGRRKLYDTTGSLSDTEELSGQSVDDLYTFYRTVYRKVTEEDIEDVSCCPPSCISHCAALRLPA